MIAEIKGKISSTGPNLNDRLEDDLTGNSSFRTQDSIEVLNQVLGNNKNYIIKCEAKRSLKLIGENYRI